MDFTLSDEQRLLQDTVARFVADQYAFEDRMAATRAPDGFKRSTWAKFADMGLLGLPFAEEYGGIGGRAEEVMLVMEQLGRGLVVEPWLWTVVLGGGLVSAAGTQRQKDEILPAVAEGRMLLALAHAEPQSRYTLSDVQATAERRGSDFVLHGRKTLVVFGDSADHLIVSARLEGGRRDARGIGLFLVPRTAEGVEVRGYPTVDGLRAAEVTLSGVKVPVDAVLGPLGLAFPHLEAAVDRAIAALCAEAVGVMGKVNEITLDYLKTRKQFGVPIGNFQVLQHRMVDMTTAYEQARSMMYLAAMHADDSDAQRRRRQVSAAKALIGRSGKAVGQGAVQLHGGIGITMEYSVGHYFKRLTAIDLTFGDTDHHLGLFADAA